MVAPLHRTEETQNRGGNWGRSDGCDDSRPTGGTHTDGWWTKGYVLLLVPMVLFSVHIHRGSIFSWRGDSIIFRRRSATQFVKWFVWSFTSGCDRRDRTAPELSTVFILRTQGVLHTNANSLVNRDQLRLFSMRDRISLDPGLGHKVYGEGRVGPIH